MKGENSDYESSAQQETRKKKKLDDLYEPTIFNCWHQIEIRLLWYKTQKKLVEIFF